MGIGQFHAGEDGVHPDAAAKQHSPKRRHGIAVFRPEEARTEDDVGFAFAQRLEKRRDVFRAMLSVGVEVDDVARPPPQSEGHAGLQGRPLSKVDVVVQRVDGDVREYPPRIVGGPIVDNDDGVSELLERNQRFANDTALVERRYDDENVPVHREPPRSPRPAIWRQATRSTENTVMPSVSNTGVKTSLRSAR